MYLLVNSTLPRQNGQRLKVYRADYRAKNIFIIIVLLLSNFHIYGRRSKILEIKNFTKIIIGLKGEINWILVQKLPKFWGFERKFPFLADFQNKAIWWYSRGYDLKTPLDLDRTEFWYGNLRRFFWRAKCGFKVNSGVKSGQAGHLTVQGHSYDQHLNLQKSWIPRFWSKYRLQGPLLTLTLPINDPKVCSRFLRWSRFFKSISRISRNTRGDI